MPFLALVASFISMLYNMTATILRKSCRAFKDVLKNNFFEHQLLTSSSNMLKDERTTHTTVDPADVEGFSKLMKEWWEPNGQLKSLHSMNLVRIPLIRDGLVQCSLTERNIKPLKDKTILDVGCGGGILSEGLARIGAIVTGIDASKELIDLANVHKDLDPRIAENKPTYIHATVEDHVNNFKNYYDGVVASEVIEHVNNKELFVKSCVTSLKPGGRIFFTTPNRTRLSQLGAIFLAENILRIVPRGTHQYEKFITPNELTFLLERNDCHVEAIYGLFYHFITNTWQFIGPQHLMYALQAVKLK
ncbi:hypothetical protein K1T71_001216 [Dendrolimus kikuchii]|uniref:Uncharacterized protein n=1 Tax=Dendrolimus kikuchii TaxID=765133 RepID=A0ACC1DH56_9NEOP|nr:hypothetical protein K1T71_001216 [Dendrolimus kikuchii]